MLNETSKTWLFEQWGTNNPVRIDAQTAWEILKHANSGVNEAKSVWKEYASHKHLPEDPKEAAIQINNFENFVSKIYVERIRW